MLWCGAWWDRQAAIPYLEARKVLSCKAVPKKLLCLFSQNFNQWCNKRTLESARSRHGLNCKKCRHGMDWDMDRLALKWRTRFRDGIITATAQCQTMMIGGGGRYEIWCPHNCLVGGTRPSPPPPLWRSSCFWATKDDEIVLFLILTSSREKLGAQNDPSVGRVGRVVTGTNWTRACSL